MDSSRAGRWTMSDRTFRRIALVTTAGLCLLVVAGGVVRLTGSGLGCADWPRCSEERFIDVSSGHTAIEQLNRLLSGLIAVPTVAMVVGAFRVRPRRPARGSDGLVVPSLGVLVTVVANAVVGGIAVRTELHPAMVQSHFLLAMASIAFAVVAVRRSGGRTVVMPPNSLRRSGWVMAGATATAIATGTVVTGTGPHAGDETARRFEFDISTVARVHSVSVIVALVCALVVGATLRRAESTVRLVPTYSAWVFIALLQALIGYVQYLTGVPETLVAAHIAGATALWVVTVWLTTALVTRSSGRAETSRASGDSAAVTPAVDHLV